MMNQNLIVKDENGNLIDMSVICTFEANDKKYIAFSDNKKDSEGNLEVQSASYIEKEGFLQLQQIDEEEKKLIKEAIELAKVEYLKNIEE